MKKRFSVKGKKGKIRIAIQLCSGRLKTSDGQILPAEKAIEENERPLNLSAKYSGTKKN